MRLALVCVLTSACVAVQRPAPPTAGGEPPIEPPGACIYKVVIANGQVTVTFNPSPCPKEIHEWHRKVFKLPESGFCGIELGSDTGSAEIILNLLPCPIVPKQHKSEAGPSRGASLASSRGRGLAAFRGNHALETGLPPARSHRRVV